MLVKHIEFEDYNGNKREEDFYFNLEESEVMELELGETGGYAEMINRIIAAQDAPSIVDIFKKIILKAYGVKSPDGREFVKSEELSKKFSQTRAYSKLFMELATDADAGAAFINGIMPNGAEIANKELVAPALTPVN